MLYAVEGVGLFVPYPKGTAPVGCTWSYRGGDGALVGGLSAQAIASNGAVIPLGGHTLTAPSLFEFRSLLFSHPQGQETVSVTLTKFYMISTTAQEARGLVGLNQAELPDEDVDFINAALDLDISSAGAFRTALRTSRAAQRLLLLHTLLLAETSLEMRVAQKMASDTVSFTRFNGADLAQNLSRLRNERDLLLTSVLGQTAPTLPTRTVFTLSATRTDPFPGA